MNSAAIGDTFVKRPQKQKKRKISPQEPTKQANELDIQPVAKEPEFSIVPAPVNDIQTPTPGSIIKEIKKGDITVTETSPGIFLATSTTSNYMIEYDRNKCIGAASCAAIAPLTFFMNEENLAEFNTTEGRFDDDETILSGAQSCPVFAIRILDKVTNEVIFPIE